jgi:Ca2+-binding RTX toxin-like protein
MVGKRAIALSLVLVLSMLSLTSAAEAAPVIGANVLYTTDEDFDKGTSVNVNHDSPNNNQLRLNTDSGAFPFIWVALSQRCTIAKVKTSTGAKLGEYRTVSDSTECMESSRTTVGLDGSVWVGHRGSGRVTHVGLIELNQCIDRNNDGTIQTSGAYGDVKPWPGVAASVELAEDECILHHINTGGSDSRHMSVDAEGNLWVGDRDGSNVFRKYNGSTGALMAGPFNWNCGGYGGLIDGNGVIWSATPFNGSILRWDPDEPSVDANLNLATSNPRCIPINNYGMAIDANGYVWVGSYGTEVRKVSPDGNSVEVFSKGSGANPYAQGLAVDRNGDVWISSSNNCFSDCSITRLRNDGSLVGHVPTPTGPGSTGVSVDADGKVWTANINSHSATRIDPTLNGGLGAVDLEVSFPATEGRPLPFPYNYSDMTGAQLLNSTSPQGEWTVVQDGETAGTQWGTVTWNTEQEGGTPAGSSITVEAKTAESLAALGSSVYAQVTNGTAFIKTGRFIQIRATMKPGEANATPILSDIRIQSSPDLDPDPHTLDVTIVGPGSVTSDDGGIDCGINCTEDYDHGTEVVLTANPGTNSNFTTWSGACTNTTGTCSVTMSEARSVTATYVTSGTGTVGGGGTPNPSPSPSPGASGSPSPSPTPPLPVPTEATCGGYTVTIQVATANEITSGTEGPDVINGTSGSDTIHGLEGNDIICGRAGNDSIYGENRIDTIFGGSGRDKLYGGSGADGGIYGDKLFGGTGRDRLLGDGGDDHLEGGLGDDWLFGNADNDKLYGNAGGDHLYGDTGKDHLHGGLDTDACAGGAGLGDTGTFCEPFIQ